MLHGLVSRRSIALVIALAALAFLPGPAAGHAADKPALWVEVRTPHLTVYSDGGAKTARRIATRFEQIRNVFLQTLSHIRVDPGQPIIILAARNEKSLAALLPKLYAKKGGVRPTGLFNAGPDRNYIVLRADASGDFAYHTLYHEYTHLVTHLNARYLPAWLEEGYAEFFGNTRITGRNVSLGWAPQGEIEFLRQSRLLPLAQLFRVDHHSPYYNEAAKANVFYAESWALVHMLLLDPAYAKSNRLSAYGAAVNAGADPVEAGRRAFGDLAKLQRRLESYVRLERGYPHAELRSPIDRIQKSFAVRTLSQPETDTLLGNFFVARDRPAIARPLLERALRAAPDSAAANEGLGSLELRVGDRQAATRYFARAVQLHSPSFLAYYYRAITLLDTAPPGSSPSAEAEQTLRKAVALNPRFSPAYAALAEDYARQPGKLDQALQAARKAVSLSPSDWRAQLALALVLAGREQFDQARTIARRVASTAPGRAAAAAASAALASIAKRERYQAQLRRYGAPPVPAPPSSPQPMILDRQNGTPAHPNSPTPVPSAAAQPPPAAPAVPAAVRPNVRLFGMTGRITAARCAPAPEALLTLSLGGITMKLHATNLSQVTFRNAAGARTHPTACARLAGKAVHIRYTLTHEKPYDGEISSIAPARLP